jgi:hypothetical protein
MPEIVHTYLKNENKCFKCLFYNTEQNVRKHINSNKNKNGELCKKYQNEYSNWYYDKMR